MIRKKRVWKVNKKSVKENRRRRETKEKERRKRK